MIDLQPAPVPRTSREARNHGTAAAARRRTRKRHGDSGEAPSTRWKQISDPLTRGTAPFPNLRRDLIGQRRHFRRAGEAATVSLILRNEMPGSLPIRRCGGHRGRDWRCVSTRVSWTIAALPTEAAFGVHSAAQRRFAGPLRLGGGDPGFFAVFRSLLLAGPRSATARCDTRSLSLLWWRVGMDLFQTSCRNRRKRSAGGL